MGIGKFIDLTGQRFGRLTVLERSINKGKQKRTTWKCQCDCGNIITVFGYNLKNNHTKSCGCLSVENGRNKRKSNDYDLTGDYGIGYTFNKDSNGNNYFLFDLDDFVKIKDYCWRFSKQDYLVAYGGEKSTIVYLHSIIIGKKDGFVIDHINHNKFDNRKNNLRVCTHSQNMQNRTPKNVYGINGISYCKSRKKYEVYIAKIHLGYYDNLEDAIAARKEAEEKYFGEYSYDNSIGIQDKDEG